jgi:diguanylate cyclase (GGDEF)-like protein/PAS domain S-box-containing protein
MVGTHVDITEQKQAEDKLRQAATVFENTAEGVMITDAQKCIVAVNRAFTGYEQADVLGKPPTVLHSSQHTAEHYESAWNLAQTTGRWQGEIWSQRKSGEVYPQWLTISSIRSNAGDLTNYVGVFADITPIKESQQQLEHIAHHDPLTDLPNRLLLHARLEHAMERAHREKNLLAVLFLDLDRFKNVNDTLGHPAGDRLLQAVAKQLVNYAREDDTVARLGGDEFTILLEGLQEPKDAGAVAYKILQTITKPFRLDGHEVYVTGSVGISLYPDDGQDVTTLLKNADSAMYRAKEQGRNNYQFYTKELTATAFERFALESSLRHALDRGEFTLHYQMQVSLADDRVVGAEALLRWQHPELGLVAPAQFIPLAEETGLIVELGEWVLRTTCTQAKAWQNEGLLPLRIAVNVSSVQVTRSRIVDTVAEILEDTGLDPRRLELEITEGLLMGQSAQTIATLDALKAMGVTLALDDFGTGYSSLSYLKRLPLDRLKIDRSFIRDIPHDAGDVAITRAVIALGNNLQLSVIAEGVEKNAQLDILHADRCDEVQGWLYGTPLPATEFAELVRSRIG